MQNIRYATDGRAKTEKEGSKTKKEESRAKQASKSKAKARLARAKLAKEKVRVRLAKSKVKKNSFKKVQPEYKTKVEGQGLQKEGGLLKAQEEGANPSKPQKQVEGFHLYKINVNPTFTKNQIKNMVESLFNVQVLKVNTSRRYLYKKSSPNQLPPAPKVLKQAFVKTEAKAWNLKEKINE